MNGGQRAFFLYSLIVAATGLLVVPATVLADDGELIIIRDVPPHVPYRAIPPGQVESWVNTSPASQVNSAVGNDADHHNHLLNQELSDTEFAALGTVFSGGAQARSRQDMAPASMDTLLSASTSNSNAGQLEGLTSMFGGAGSMLSNNVNSVTGSIGRTITGSLANVGGR